jgi:hypothetical protein
MLSRAKYRSSTAKRRTGVEPATSSLGSLRWTTEVPPQCAANALLYVRPEQPRVDLA